jgi:hypothetical protein
VAHAEGAPLACGVVNEAADWNKQDQHRDLSAFEGELCRAVATAAQVSAGIRAFKSEPDAAASLQSGTVSLGIGIIPVVMVADS